MRSPGIIHTTDWPDFGLVVVPAPGAGNDVTYQVNGWRWWAVTSAVFTANTAAGPAATPFLQVSKGGVVMYKVGGLVTLGVGVVQFYQWSTGCSPNSLPGVFEQQSMPYVPIIGDGVLGLARSGGDFNFQFGQVTFILVGEKTRVGNT